MTQSERPPVPRPPAPGVPGVPPRPPAPKAPPPPGAAVATAISAPAQATVATTRVMVAPRNKGPSPGHPTLVDIVKLANEEGASDVHLGVNEPPRLRKRGDIVPLDWPNTDLNTFMSWLMEVLTDEEIQQFQENLDFDGAADLGFVRIRISIFDALNGPSLVLRLIGSSILTLEQLKLPDVFKKICNYHKGLILVTGPTGSGKSTTLAAMIDYMNRNYAYNIITIEDPVEFVHESKKSLIKHREVGRHTLKFF
jgi:Tfp pilus assembly protein, pilus retraction ATPase PilT